MKKQLAILLVISMFFLWGCNVKVPEVALTIPTTPEGNMIAPARPEINVIDHEAPTLIVTVRINPEFELLLSNDHTILSAKPLNEDAEALLSTLEVVGQPYYTGFLTILEKAEEQKFLKPGDAIAISVAEASRGGWTVASQRQLEMPVEEYQERSGVAFDYQFQPAGAVADVEKATHTSTYTVDGQEFVEYYNGTELIVTKTVRPDGTLEENYKVGEGHRFVMLCYYPDGSFSYTLIVDLVHTTYWTYPDGSRARLVEKIKDARMDWALYEDPSGSTFETFYYYVGNTKVGTLSLGSDGTRRESFYHLNGKQDRVVTSYPDGTNEEIYDENEQLRTVYFRHTDGTESHAEYENGRLKTVTMTTANGDHWTESYREDGTYASVVGMRDGARFEERYDENGQLFSVDVWYADGSTWHAEYENGELVKETYTNSDGSTQPVESE